MRPELKRRFDDIIKIRKCLGAAQLEAIDRAMFSPVIVPNTKKKIDVMAANAGTKFLAYKNFKDLFPDGNDVVMKPSWWSTEKTLSKWMPL